MLSNFITFYFEALVKDYKLFIMPSYLSKLLSLQHINVCVRFGVHTKSKSIKVNNLEFLTAINNRINSSKL